MLSLTACRQINMTTDAKTYKKEKLSKLIFKSLIKSLTVFTKSCFSHSTNFNQENLTEAKFKD